MKRAIFLIAVIGILVGFLTETYAGCPFAKAAPKEEEVVNEVCPISGAKIDQETKIRTEHQGKEIGFCCLKCINDFKEDPDKYIEEPNPEDDQ